MGRLGKLSRCGVRALADPGRIVGEGSAGANGGARDAMRSLGNVT